MSGYGELFARAYNIRWSAYARRVAPLIYDFCRTLGVGTEGSSVLDLCCGTGQLAEYFLAQGCDVTGLDLSPYMLKHAEENAQEYVLAGKARFIQGDATDFTLDRLCHLAVCTFSAMNHLADESALERCFRCVRNVCDGPFVFDIDTVRGVKASTMFQVDDLTEEMLLVSQGVYDPGRRRACLRFVGCAATASGEHFRFDETVYHTGFELEVIEDVLRGAGWTKHRFSRIDDLQTALSRTDAQQQTRIFVCAC